MYVCMVLIQLRNRPEKYPMYGILVEKPEFPANEFGIRFFLGKKSSSLMITNLISDSLTFEMVMENQEG